MTSAIQLIHRSNGFPLSQGDTINDFVAVTNLGTHEIDTVTISSDLGLSYTEISSFNPSQGLQFNISGANSSDLFDSDETWYSSSPYEISQEDLSSDGSADGALTHTITVTARAARKPARIDLEPAALRRPVALRTHHEQPRSHRDRRHAHLRHRRSQRRQP